MKVPSSVLEKEVPARLFFDITVCMPLRTGATVGKTFIVRLVPRNCAIFVPEASARKMSTEFPTRSSTRCELVGKVVLREFSNNATRSADLNTEFVVVDLKTCVMLVLVAVVFVLSKAVAPTGP